MSGPNAHAGLTDKTKRQRSATQDTGWHGKRERGKPAAKRRAIRTINVPEENVVALGFVDVTDIELVVVTPLLGLVEVVVVTATLGIVEVVGPVVPPAAALNSYDVWLKPLDL